MALDNFLEWSVTPASNIDVAGTNIQNTGLVSQGDDALRAIMGWAAQGFRTITYLMDTATLDLRGSNIATQVMNIAGTATVTTVNLEDTQFRICKIESARQFTASATLIINGSTTTNFTTTANDVVMFMGDPSSVVRMTVIGPTLLQGSTTPTITAGTGTITTVSATLAYTKISRQVLWNCTITITTNGTGGTFLNIPMPFTCGSQAGACAGFRVGDGITVAGRVAASSATASINLATGAYPGADGAVITVGGSFNV